jgi:hypothetical protein
MLGGKTERRITKEREGGRKKIRLEIGSHVQEVGIR